MGDESHRPPVVALHVKHEREPMDNRPISATDAKTLIRLITKRRDDFASHSVPWHRHNVILNFVRAAQDATERRRPGIPDPEPGKKDPKGA